jgi:hypothetical protein
MPSLWIEYHTNLWEFWKVKRLALKLSIPYAHALGLVSCLWVWTATNKADGNLTKFSDAEIADAARWGGEVNGFVGYLKECELLDADGKLHDWDKHGLRVILESRRRQQEYRDRKAKNTNKRGKRHA